MKPFIKWAGGKTQLLNILQENINKCEYDTYIECFVGGGALFFHLLSSQNKIRKFIINDVNNKLITTYNCIKYNVEDLIEELFKLQKEYNSLCMNKKEELYYKIRDEFNSNNINDLLISRDFIFLNKCGFNGLYRENSKGKFNVPFGKKETLNLFEEENLRNISKMLNAKIDNQDLVEIKSVDFEKLIDYIDNKTLVYLDPPYRPITKNGFTAYNKSNFNDEEQIRLSKFCDNIHNKNGKFLLSNSDPKNLDIEDNFFDDLYKQYDIQRVNAKRSINSNGSGRGKVFELLIKNY